MESLKSGVATPPLTSPISDNDKVPKIFNEFMPTQAVTLSTDRSEKCIKVSSFLAQHENPLIREFHALSGAAQKSHAEDPGIEADVDDPEECNEDIEGNMTNLSEDGSPDIPAQNHRQINLMPTKIGLCNSIKKKRFGHTVHHLTEIPSKLNFVIMQIKGRNIYK